MMDRDEILPEGTLVKVEIEIRVPKAATVGEIEDWLRYSFNDTGSISGDNPLLEHAPEPFGLYSFTTEITDEIGVEERYDETPLPGGGVSYRTRYRRLPALSLASPSQGD